MAIRDLVHIHDFEILIFMTEILFNFHDWDWIHIYDFLRFKLWLFDNLFEFPDFFEILFKFQDVYSFLITLRFSIFITFQNIIHFHTFFEILFIFMTCIIFHDLNRFILECLIIFMSFWEFTRETSSNICIFLLQITQLRRHHR